MCALSWIPRRGQSPAGARRVYFYACLSNWKRGSTICANDLILPVEKVDEAVLKALGGDTLRPAVIHAIVDDVLQQLVQTNVEHHVVNLHRQLRILDTQIQHLTTAIEQGGAHLPSIIALLSERQHERDGVRAALASAETLQQIQVDRQAIEAKV